MNKTYFKPKERMYCIEVMLENDGWRGKAFKKEGGARYPIMSLPPLPAPFFETSAEARAYALGVARDNELAARKRDENLLVSYSEEFRGNQIEMMADEG